MPQMAPIMWMHLFLLFNTTVLMLAMKIFFQPKLFTSSGLISTLNLNKKIWKL